MQVKLARSAGRRGLSLLALQSRRYGRPALRRGALRPAAHGVGVDVDVKTTEYNTQMKKQMAWADPFEYHFDRGLYYHSIDRDLLCGTQPRNVQEVDELFREERVTTILNVGAAWEGGQAGGCSCPQGGAERIFYSQHSPPPLLSRLPQLQQDKDMQYWGINFVENSRRCQELGINLVRTPVRCAVTCWHRPNNPHCFACFPSRPTTAVVSLAEVVCAWRIFRETRDSSTATASVAADCIVVALTSAPS